ncbi:MAG: TonB C-terminal domain-containing protein [Myxococcales bacterium]|nr:TonB C-terminal domain-containing protein [Myxococcales bacterium]MCB9718687.1 TonB C-terminal domain-containing protein [Myxococcales bacterium]
MVRAEPRGGRDLRPSDLLLGLGVAAAVLGLAGFTLDVARLRHRVDLPPVDPGLGVPIAVRPILDLPSAGSAGGGGGTAMVPASWARAPAVGSGTGAGPEAVVAEAAAGGAPGGAARRHGGRSSALGSALPSVEELGEDPSEPGPGQGEGVGAEGADDAPMVGGASGDGSEAGGAGGDGGAGGGAGEGDGPGGDGEDPRAARAVALYRDRLARWLAARFSVRGSGLSREQLRRQRVRAILRIAEDGTVADFEVIDSGNAAFDQGARAALESVRGLPLPIPPDHYPTAIPREIHVSFVCKESQCD